MYLNGSSNDEITLIARIVKGRAAKNLFFRSSGDLVLPVIRTRSKGDWKERRLETTEIVFYSLFCEVLNLQQSKVAMYMVILFLWQMASGRGER